MTSTGEIAIIRGYTPRPVAHSSGLPTGLHGRHAGPADTRRARVTYEQIARHVLWGMATGAVLVIVLGIAVPRWIPAALAGILIVAVLALAIHAAHQLAVRWRAATARVDAARHLLDGYES